MSRKLIIGSRGSDLALWQAKYVQNLLVEQAYEVEIKIIKTQGDLIQNVTFDKLEGKGFFTKELEDNLLAEKIDIAVHSFKDLPTENPEGLIIAGNSYRETPEDWLVINKQSLDISKHWNLKERAVIGTSSPRRAAQLLAFRSDLQIVPIRGNVPTRVKKAYNEVDAVVLAGAGLVRLDLDLSDFEIFKFDARKFVPAAVQGILAYQTSENNEFAIEAISKIHNVEVEKAVAVERKILNKLEGGCQLPIGVFCQLENETYKVWAFYQEKFSAISPKKATHKRIYREGKDVEKLVANVVEALKAPFPKKVFISRIQGKKSYFKLQLESLGYEVEGKSLLDFKVLDIFELPKADWIFFSSRKGVEFFFQLVPRFNGMSSLLMYKIACMGSGTADELSNYGFTPDYVGNDEGIDIVAKEFEAVAKNQSVLFPQATSSKQSVQNKLSDKVHINNWVIYENTEIENLEPLTHEVLAFTSSKNVDAYFSKHKLQDYQRVLAIGTSTAATLKTYGIENVEIAWQASEMGLVDVL